jgi:hypothetical protein
LDNLRFENGDVIPDVEGYFTKYWIKIFIFIYIYLVCLILFYHFINE